MKRVTIKDIAKIAGVSHATISRALNGSDEVSPETRARIEEICQREGYRANSLARSLVSSRTNVIGLILPDISHPFYAELALNVEIAARRHNDTIMMCNSLHDVQQVGVLLDCLTGYQVDGVILASSRDDVSAFLSAHPPAVPTVLLGDCLDNRSGSVCSTVSLDNLCAGQMGTDYLISLGHRSIVYVGSRAGSATHTHRCTGYEQAMRAHGLNPMVIAHSAASSSLEQGYALAMALFLSDEPCTAIFAATDSIAIGVMKAADELHIRIPQELSLLGVDNSIFSSLTRTNLTSIDQRKQQLAETSVQLLHEQIIGKDTGRTTHCVIRPTLSVRETCAPPHT